MIAKLKGIVDSVGDGFAIVDVAGVGYLVFASARTLGRLGVGEAASLLVETHVREDHIHLYGFWDALERDWYRLLTTVQGVGAKVALAVLSALSADELAHAIAAQDRAMITRANGVGPKLATRILSELKDKTGALALGLPAGLAGEAAAGARGGLAGPAADAVSALVNLGYGRGEALGAVARAAIELGDRAGIEALIRAGLSQLAAHGLEHRR